MFNVFYFFFAKFHLSASRAIDSSPSKMARLASLDYRMTEHTQSCMLRVGGTLRVSCFRNFIFAIVELDIGLLPYMVQMKNILALPKPDSHGTFAHVPLENKNKQGEKSILSFFF